MEIQKHHLEGLFVTHNIKHGIAMLNTRLCVRQLPKIQEFQIMKKFAKLLLLMDPISLLLTDSILKICVSIQY